MSSKYPTGMDKVAITNLAIKDISLKSTGNCGLRGFWPSQDEEACSNGVQFRQVYDDLRGYLDTQGPFDGLVGFSEGASVAATLMIEDVPRQDHSHRFKCGIFFCGLLPILLQLDQDSEIRLANPLVDGVLLRVPTAHIWSRNDKVLPGMSKQLVELCDKNSRGEVVHEIGHDVPGSSSDESLKEAVRLILRTIEKSKDYTQ